MDFVKLDAAGNDFIALDVRSRGADWRPDSRDALLWCDRRHGVGADGILLLGPGADGLDYHLTFLNPDGSEAFCGNGARAAFAWWRSSSWEPTATSRKTRGSRPSMGATKGIGSKTSRAWTCT